MGKQLDDLVAFQRAADLVVSIYEVTSQFPAAERFGLTSQLRRAAVGVASQIAEGQGRLTYGEWRQFLSQARGSLYEVEAQLFVAERLGFAKTEQLGATRELIRGTASALAGLIRWVKSHERPTSHPGNR